MNRKMTFIAVLVFAFGLAYWGADVGAQKVSKSNERGQKMFAQYCASCHGVDGKGNGPAASALKTGMPDLTRIPKVDGKFPGLRVMHAISGDKDIPAHGSKDMPVWGAIFREKKGNTGAQLDIYALQEYIESIQQK